ncbi:MAG: phosphotransferase family protein, partial [Marmoricola sp.]
MSDVVEKPEVAPVRSGEDLDWPALEGYLRNRLPSVAGEFSVLQFPNGSANLTYLVRFGDDRVVVRRPPFGEIAKGAHDMSREYSVLSRLYDAYPRAPRALHYCADGAVIGAPFLVSEYRPGIVVWERVPEQLVVGTDPGRRIGFAVVDALADLHNVDPAACGLADFGRPEGYLERQVHGWQRRWEVIATESGHPIERVGEQLARQVPES